MARVLGTEYGVDVTLGRGEKPALDIAHQKGAVTEHPYAQDLRRAGAAALADSWTEAYLREGPPDPALWEYPDVWLEHDTSIPVGARTLDAVHTPGHTPGHYVFADRAAELLFSGDHVLPTITPSIGFGVPQTPQPLGDFMASLSRVRSLPDLMILPAHGPVAPSSHRRVDELLLHHEDRLEQCLTALRDGARDPTQVAGELGWTRHGHVYDSLDFFNQGLASMETKAHLELLVARGQATRTEHTDGVVTFASLD